MTVSHASRAPVHILRQPCLVLGGIVGLLLAAMAIAWVLVANRIPSLDHFADQRNLVAGIGVGILLLVPVFRFLKSPMRIFFSGLIAWTILSLTYGAMEGGFPRLGTRLGAFHLFMLGAVVNALLANVVWVTQMVILARQQTFVSTRRRLP